MLAALGAVQLDTISVLARTHLLVAWSRLGAVRTGEDRSGLLVAGGADHLRVLGTRRLHHPDRALADL